MAKNLEGYSRLSKWMDRKELRNMAEGLDVEGKKYEIKYRKGTNRCAIYIEKEESFDVPHWILWKWCGWQFNRR